MPRLTAWCLALVAVLGLLGEGLGAQEFPQAVGRVSDFARLLTPDQRQAIETMLENLERETTAEQRAALDRDASAGPGMPIEWILPFLGIFIAIGSGFGGAGIGSRTLGLIFFGLIFGGIPLFLAFLPGSSTGVWILLGLALVTLIVGIHIGRQPSTRASLRGAGKASKGGWVWGESSSGRRGGGSSGWSGGSGSSGSFGVGSSGGGGASGRW